MSNKLAIKVRIIGVGIRAGVYRIHKLENESNDNAVKRLFGNHINILEVLNE